MRKMPFIELAKQEEREILPGLHAVFIHTEGMTLAYWRIEAGAVLPEHTHFHEQVATVIEGRFELTLDGHARVLDQGTVAVIPSEAPHSGKALTPCRILDAFHPVREDYR